MAHRSPTPEELARADDWTKNARRDETGKDEVDVEMRLELLVYILNSDFDAPYKQAAKDLLRYYASFIAPRCFPADADPEKKAVIQKAAKEYKRLPIQRRRDIEGPISPSTISRYMHGQTQKLKPLTEIRLALVLGLPCLEI